MKLTKFQRNFVTLIEVAVGIYALRSYGLHKEQKGYKKGVLVTAMAYEKKGMKAENGADMLAEAFKIE